MSKNKYALNKNGMPNQAFIRGFDVPIVEYIWPNLQAELLVDLINGAININDLREEVMYFMNERAKRENENE